jgi:dTDP-4-amino-4,6-dideoxygalactose transaminase
MSTPETIRITVPSIDEDDVQAVAAVLRSGFLVQGPKVAEFERLFANYVGTEHCVATTNCTEALFLSLLGMGIGRGDKVAVCTYSWPATANAAILVGAEPVFVDIEANTFNMRPDALAAALKSDPAIRAVIPVHTFGNPADMAALLDVCKDIPLVEDAACGLGTELNGKRAGSFGRTGCFSLHPRKAITTGEGGMITTNDADLARKMRAHRNHGMAPDAPRVEFVEAGHNLRMTEFQAALGLSQFTKLERIIAARTAGAKYYDERLRGTDVTPPAIQPGGRHVYQSYVTLLPKGEGLRDRVIAHMKEAGIETTLGTYHMPAIKYYRERHGDTRGRFPVSEDISARTLTLPLYEGLGVTAQARVVDTLLDAVKRG